MSRDSFTCIASSIYLCTLIKRKLWCSSYNLMATPQLKLARGPSSFSVKVTRGPLDRMRYERGLLHKYNAGREKGDVW